LNLYIAPFFVVVLLSSSLLRTSADKDKGDAARAFLNLRADLSITVLAAKWVGLLWIAVSSHSWS